MKTIAWLTSGLFLMAAILALPANGQDVSPLADGAVPAPQITVQLASGRTFTAAVDSRTSDRALVLRFERPGIVLWRSIDWRQVTGAFARGEPIAADQVRSAALAMRSEAANLAPSLETRAESFPATELAPRDVEQTLPPPAITSITFDAQIANWDRDVETDGLLVELWPLSADGHAVPASGTVEIELYAPQQRVFHHAPRSGGATIERIERWVRSVSPRDFTASGLRLKLPFGAVHPEFDLDWIGVGLVHVKFAAPGHGVFESSYDGVRVRPFAPIRDQLELKGWPRSLPNEGVGRWQ
jgi:hypothetical protein